MKYYLYNFSAVCAVLSLEENRKSHAIKHNSRPNLLIEKVFFPSRLNIAGPGEILPGEEKSVQVEVIVDEPSGALFCEGVTFNLCDGPENVIGNCQISQTPTKKLISY